MYTKYACLELGDDDAQAGEHALLALHAEVRIPVDRPVRVCLARKSWNEHPMIGSPVSCTAGQQGSGNPASARGGRAQTAPSCTGGQQRGTEQQPPGSRTQRQSMTQHQCLMMCRAIRSLEQWIASACSLRSYLASPRRHHSFASQEAPGSFRSEPASSLWPRRRPCLLFCGRRSSVSLGFKSPSECA